MVKADEDIGPAATTLSGHYGHDLNCPVQGKKCESCGGAELLQAYANPNFHKKGRSRGTNTHRKDAKREIAWGRER